MFRKLLFLTSLAGALACAAPPTAKQIVEQIQKATGVEPKPGTVDTFKAGDPDTPVTGIAVTMMATLEVLEHAAAQGKNLIITHEPTFYNHQDTTAALADLNDPVLAEKQRFIRDHHLVIWRFHDGWHARQPDGIQEGMTHALDWQSFQRPNEPHLFRHPNVTLDSLATELKTKLKIHVMRVVGDSTMPVSDIAMLPGAADSMQQMKMLERPDVQVLVIGETREWETVEYVADAVTEHKSKALIILGHIPSEQAGMEECTRWLRTFMNDVPITFVPASEPFWQPPVGPRIVPLGASHE